MDIQLGDIIDVKNIWQMITQLKNVLITYQCSKWVDVISNFHNFSLFFTKSQLQHSCKWHAIENFLVKKRVFSINGNISLFQTPRTPTTLSHEAKNHLKIVGMFQHLAHYNKKDGVDNDWILLIQASMHLVWNKETRTPR